MALYGGAKESKVDRVTFHTLIWAIHYVSTPFVIITPLKSNFDVETPGKPLQTELCTTLPIQ